jgi:hypothetical protein
MGFLSLLFCGAALARCAVKSKNARAHCAIGAAALLVSVLHAALALWGCPQLSPAAVSGLVCVTVLAALAAVYLLRGRMPKLWLRLHRVLAVALVAGLVLHLLALKL